MASVNPELDFTGWLPIRTWQRAGEWRVDWCWFGQQRLTRPFLRDDVDAALRLPFNQAFRRETGLQALLDWQQRSPGISPSALVFHASRCGSTLIAQLLAGLERNIVLSEPPPLDNLLRAHLVDADASAWQPRALSALLSAYGQRRRGDEQQLLIKLDAWNVFEGAQLCTLYPDTPRIFLYRDPLEIVVSQMRQAGMQRVPGLLGVTALDQLLPDAAGMDPLQYTCRMIAEVLCAGLELCQRHGAVAVNYNELPHACWGRLAPLFAVTAEDHAQLQQTAAFDAKQPYMAFAADSQRKRDDASPEVRQAVTRWAADAYISLESIRLQRS